MPKLKKIPIKYIIAAALFFVPIYLLFFRLMTSYGLPEQNEKRYYSAVIEDSRGEVFELNSDKNPKDIDNIIKLVTTDVIVQDFDTQGKTEFSLGLACDNGENKDYSLFFFKPNENSSAFSCCYLIDGVAYLAGGSETDFFASAIYAESLYKYSIPPTLTTYSLDTVAPSEMYWQYKNSSGGLHPSIITDITSEIRRYFQTGKLSFSFSVEPTHANISVSNDTGLLYSGDISSFNTEGIDTSSTLYVTIRATWSDSERNEYSGGALYEFVMDHIPPAQFSINKNVVAQGGYVILSGSNVPDISKINFTSTPELDYEPIFIEGENETVYAILPIEAQTLQKFLSFDLRYGEVHQKMNLNILSYPDSDPIKITVSEEAAKYNTSESVVEYTKLISDMTASSFQGKLWNGDFLNPDNDNSVYPILRAGDKYTVGGSYTSSSSENYYYAAHGTSVYSLNSGIVDKVGFCSRLGNYLIIDHGLGVKTWYAHLSEVNVTEGTLVGKGEIIARSGSSGYAFTSGFSVFSTVNSIIISVDELIDNGIEFKSR